MTETSTATNATTKPSTITIPATVKTKTGASMRPRLEVKEFNPGGSAIKRGTMSIASDGVIFRILLDLKYAHLLKAGSPKELRGYPVGVEAAGVTLKDLFGEEIQLQDNSRKVDGKWPVVGSARPKDGENPYLEITLDYDGKNLPLSHNKDKAVITIIVAERRKQKVKITDLNLAEETRAISDSASRTESAVPANAAGEASEQASVPQARARSRNNNRMTSPSPQTERKHLEELTEEELLLGKL